MTKFYLEKKSNDNERLRDDATLNEEIGYLNGIENGYNCVNIKPKQGNGVIFNQNIIHEGCKIEGTNAKYVLKTDIIVKKNTFDDNIGEMFYISNEESKDYEKCLNYFKNAQKLEMNMKKVKANECYERSLSLRYQYPSKKYRNGNIRKKLCTSVSVVWMIIFDYVSEREIDFIIGLFPELYGAYKAYKLIYYKNNDIDSNENPILYPHINHGNCKYIPKVNGTFGAFNMFTFKNAEFLLNHEQQCLKVAAIYSLFLLSHRNDSAYYIAEYDSIKQTVKAIPMYQLLTDVFNDKASFAKYFKVKASNTEFKNNNEAYKYDITEDVGRFYNATDIAEYMKNMQDNNDDNMVFRSNDIPVRSKLLNDKQFKQVGNIKLDVKKDFDLSVDKTYMEMVHDSHNLGSNVFDGLNKLNIETSKFKDDGKPVNLKDYEYDLPDNLEDGVFDQFKGDIIRKYLNRFSIDYDDYIFQELFEYHYEKSTTKHPIKSFEEYFKCNISGNDSKTINNNYIKDMLSLDNNTFGCGLMRYIERKEDKYFFEACPFEINKVAYGIRYFNHLIFDFTKCELFIEEDYVMDNDDDTDVETDHHKWCIKHDDLIGAYLPLRHNEIKNRITSKHYIANIEPILNEYNIGFNHASCNCDFPRLNVNIKRYVGYSDIKHVHISYLHFESKNEIIMFTSYDGLSAL